VGIPPRKRQFAKRCRAHMEMVAGRLGSRRSARPASRFAGTDRSSRLIGPTDEAIGPALLELRLDDDSSVERPSSATPAQGSAWKLHDNGGWQERMVRRRLSVLPLRESERNWRAYPQGNSNSKNGAGPKGRRSLGHMDDGGNEWPGRSSAGTPRRARAWANSVTTAKPLAEPRVRDDSSVERLGLRRRGQGQSWKPRSNRRS
jgi:hypothetical protein